MPAALATKKIKLGILAVSPYEMHPLKIANALLTVNELSNGRAVVAIGGGGSVMGATGIKMDPKAQRMLRGVREAVEMVMAVTSGQFVQGYPGELFKLTRPLKSSWAKAAKPGVFTCSTGPKMLEMAGRIAPASRLNDSGWRTAASRAATTTLATIARPPPRGVLCVWLLREFGTSITPRARAQSTSCRVSTAPPTRAVRHQTA